MSGLLEQFILSIIIIWYSWEFLQFFLQELYSETTFHSHRYSFKLQMRRFTILFLRLRFWTVFPLRSSPLFQNIQSFS